MLTVREGVELYLCTTSVDMRKSVNGLSALIVDEFSESPQSGDLFIFYNRARSRVKIIWWDRNGFVIYYKRLERCKFKIPFDLSEVPLMLNPLQLSWLLAGLDFKLMTTFNDLSYSEYY